ncbi:hypothetical protein HY489_03475 [Candidatus Woesearchaeota archaeon]|nr:hypothetical protein [Candidatus Woesearchaeota archaeon]
MTTMYQNHQSLEEKVGGPCGGCGSRHRLDSRDQLQKPKSCTCSCHQMPASKFPVKRIFAKQGEYSFDQKSRFDSVASSYVSGDGRSLDTYMEGEGREAYELEGSGTADIGEAVAAILIYGDKAKFAGGHDFDQKISAFARSYGISKDWAERYVLDHENMHRWQKGRNYDSEIDAEYDVEVNLVKYYDRIGLENPKEKGMYEALKAVAQDRADNVGRNYARGSSVVSEN